MNPRDAATVMLVRDAPDLQVFMLRRNPGAVFAPGAFVFPGGAVDLDDRAPVLAAHCGDLNDVEASCRLQRAGGLGFWIAAIRETFEEAGVLLAHHGATGVPVDADEAGLSEARVALNRGAVEFSHVVAHGDLLLDTAGMHAFSHWITPPGAPRRFDTWFFVAAAPEGNVYEHDAQEAVASSWITPRDALAAHDRQEIDLIYPTRRNLEALATFGRADALLDWLRASAARGDHGRLVTESDGGEWVPLPRREQPGLGVDGLGVEGVA